MSRLSLRPWPAILAVGLLVPAAAWAQSPSPLGVSPEPVGSPVAAPSAGTGSATDPPGGTAPLPARIMEGTCEQLGDLVVDLLGVVAGGPVEGSRATVYASISDIDLPVAEIAAGGRVLIVGGESDPDSAVACGELTGPAQGPADLAVALAPMHSSAYSGTALFHEADGVTSAYVVVVAAPAEESPARSASPGDIASPAPSDQPSPGSSQAPGDLSPVRSAQPGTSGAPPFSPLPAGSPAP